MNKSVSQAGRCLNRKLSNSKKRNGIELPDDYKAFVLKYNGGVPVPGDFPLVGHREDASDVKIFYSLDDGPEDLGRAADWQVVTISGQMSAPTRVIARPSRLGDGGNK